MIWSFDAIILNKTELEVQHKTSSRLKSYMMRSDERCSSPRYDGMNSVYAHQQRFQYGVRAACLE